MSGCRAIQNKCRHNFFLPALQNERPVLRVVAASALTSLGDEETVFPRRRRIGARHCLQAKEAIRQFGPYRTFYGRRDRHLTETRPTIGSSIFLVRLCDSIATTASETRIDSQSRSCSRTRSSL